MKRLTIFFAALVLLGCAASESVRKEAELHLKGACLDMFLSSAPGKYQYVANSPTGRAAFAVASDSGGQACGMATNMAWDVQDSLLISIPNVDKVEALAIQRCEKAKSSSIKAPCRTFARGDQIVWGKSLNRGMQ
jgi:hypothetical protein